MFFFDTIKKSIVAFADIFKDLHIERVNNTTGEKRSIPIELVFATKERFYKQMNSSHGKVSIVLPAISIWQEGIEYNVSLQKNRGFGSIKIMDSENYLAKYIGNPSPVVISMGMLIKAKYYNDLNQILEEILSMFQPAIKRKIALIPNMDIFQDILIKMDSLSTNFQYEYGEDNEMTDYEAELSFSIYSFIYPPIKDVNIVKDIELRINEEEITVFQNENLPNSLVKSSNYFSKSSLFQLLGRQEINKKDNGIYYVDLMDFVNQAGDYLQLKVEDTIVPFVFEYDNDEFYGNDLMIPEGIVANKTGKVAFFYNSVNNFTLKIYVNDRRNMGMGQLILPIYEDFSIASLQNLNIEKMNEADRVYIENGLLNLISFEENVVNSLKVFPKKLIDSCEYFRVNLEFLSLDDIGKKFFAILMRDLSMILFSFSDVNKIKLEKVDDLGSILLTEYEITDMNLKIEIKNGKVYMNNDEVITVMDEIKTVFFLGYSPKKEKVFVKNFFGY